MSAKLAAEIAAFLEGKDPMRVGEIARSGGCPVPVPQPAGRWTVVAAGAEAHCAKVTAALDAAVRAGLVERYKLNGKTGPYYYRAVPSC